MKSKTWAILAQFLAQTCAIIALLGVLGYVPTRRLAGEEGLIAMALGCTVALVASLAGVLPILSARRFEHVEMVPMAMMATGLRLAVAVVLGVAVALTGWVDPRPLMVWIVIAHGGLLVPDTLLSIRVLSKRELADDTAEV